MGGAMLVGAMWFTFGGITKVRMATERVALIPIESVAPRITPADEWTRTVSDVARPSTAAVRQLDGSSIVAGAVAIRDDGYLVTSGRALAGADTVMVTTSSGTAQEASVIGTDMVTDLAVLRVSDEMTAAVISEAGAPLSGETLAVVNAAGDAQNRLVISGAATSAASDGSLYVGVIALDGSVGEVLPGSPAVDTTGAVVGIIASTAYDAPAAVVPIDLIRAITHDLIANGWVDHPRAGITARDVLPTDDNTQHSGALVTSVEANGPAADSGMLIGDVVVKVGESGVTSMAAMVAELLVHQPGETLDFLVMRDGHEVVCQVVLDASIEDES